MKLSGPWSLGLGVAIDTELRVVNFPARFQRERPREHQRGREAKSWSR